MDYMKYTWDETMCMPIDYRNKFIKHIQKKLKEQSKVINNNKYLE
jgi:hypothetical protein